MNNDPASRIRYLSRLLSALCAQEDGGEIRIAKRDIDAIAGENPPLHALFENFDAKTEEVVLNYRLKSLATYFVEEPCQTQSEPVASASIPSTLNPHATTVAQPKPGVNPGRLPLTDQQIVSLQNRLAREAHLRAIQRERQPSPSMNPLAEILSS